MVDPADLWTKFTAMGGTLVREDKTGWSEVCTEMEQHLNLFEWKYMGTSGGYRGFEACCHQCGVKCLISWNKSSLAKEKLPQIQSSKPAPQNIIMFAQAFVAVRLPRGKAWLLIN